MGTGQAVPLLPSQNGIGKGLLRWSFRFNNLRTRISNPLLVCPRASARSALQNARVHARVCRGDDATEPPLKGAAAALFHGKGEGGPLSRTSPFTFAVRPFAVRRLVSGDPFALGHGQWPVIAKESARHDARLRSSRPVSRCAWSKPRACLPHRPGTRGAGYRERKPGWKQRRRASDVRTAPVRDA